MVVLIDFGFFESIKVLLEEDIFNMMVFFFYFFNLFKGEKFMLFVFYVNVDDYFI